LFALIPQPPDADKAYYTDALRAQAQRPEQRLEIDYPPQATTAGCDNITAPDR